MRQQTCQPCCRKIKALVILNQIILEMSLLKGCQHSLIQAQHKKNYIHNNDNNDNNF